MDRVDKQCFVLMPFEDDLKEIYTEIYKPVCTKSGLHCWRVDEISRPGSISRDIIEGILSADIIIADLTRKNPNVFYELGIAHSVGNKTIMTAQGIEHVPFDVRDYRVIIYEHNLMGCEKLKTDLSKAIDELLLALDRTNNPFQEVLATRTSIGRSKRELVTKGGDFSSLPHLIREWLLNNSIRYFDQITMAHLEEIYGMRGVGKRAISLLCKILINSDQFPEPEALNDFVIKHAIDASGQRHSW
ncbi:MAG: hypothetical protein FP814_05435 [Desulfobacterium sp.]|nr:hypothetical protein [Desulfobacteraceae bacterium]MBA3035920.1 hypothetical protein [Desulfobacterium sp.]MBU4034924.1 hypothetical protein [Pseudomonadota bacterium]